MLFLLLAGQPQDVVGDLDFDFLGLHPRHFGDQQVFTIGVLELKRRTGQRLNAAIEFKPHRAVPEIIEQAVKLATDAVERFPEPGGTDTEVCTGTLEAL